LVDCLPFLSSGETIEPIGRYHTVLPPKWGKMKIWDNTTVNKTQESKKKRRAGAGPKDVKPLNADIRLRIGDRLRAMYEDVVNEGVPDRFADLLRQIEAKNPGNPPKQK